MTSLERSLDDVLTKTRRKSGAHGLILHAKTGDRRLDYRGAAGEAEADDLFPIASITKMFTAAIIRQLCDAGELDLDQTAAELLPHLDLSDLHTVKGVAYGPRLTIRQLLFQTSGLADYYEGGVAEDVKKGRDQTYDVTDVLEMAKTRAPMAAPDSGKAHYSDTNFQLLGAVIEAVTGQDYARNVQTRISEPLGLAETALMTPDASASFLPVYHESRRLDVPRTLASMGPDGGVVSTGADLMRFLRAFMAGGLFAPDALPGLMAWRPLSFPREYGGGLMRFKLPSWMTLWRPTPELIGHSGASGTFAFHAPGPDLFMVGTFNQTDAPRRPFTFMLEVARVVEQGGR